jgi:hypothetical protein
VVIEPASLLWGSGDLGPGTYPRYVSSFPETDGAARDDLTAHARASNLPLLICLLCVSASSGQQDIPAYLASDPRLGESLNVTLVGSLQVEAPWDPEEGGFFPG